jgi:NAD(P)-dependent dehydrogenase (short-subunit alcohol dehydrogenase family)
MPDPVLSGRSAVVTGGGRGIGRAIAVGLAAAGAKVAVVSRSSDPLDEAVREIEGVGGTGFAFGYDLTETAGIPGLFDQASEALGGLDILVNCAGVQITGPTLEVTEADWDATIDANLKALFFCCQEGGKRMIAQGHGKIINMGSTFAVAGMPTFAAYCASKGGVLLLTRALASEWAGLGVNVNAIGPTAVRTEMNAYLFEDEEFLASFMPKIPAGRTPTPEDVANAAVFLASPAADMIHGDQLMVDGGYTVI